MTDILQEAHLRLGKSLDDDFAFWSSPENAARRIAVWGAYDLISLVLKDRDADCALPSPIKFMDGEYEREIVWTNGDESVGIKSGYEIPEDQCSISELQEIIKKYCFKADDEGRFYCARCYGVEEHQLDCPIGEALKGSE